jgi:hypothetical protein
MLLHIISNKIKYYLSTNYCQLNNLFYLSKLNPQIMQKSKLRNIVLAILGIVFLVACTSKTIVPTPVSKAPVSFSNDVLPVFTSNCAISGCHVAGNIAPDLTTSKAYNSLMTMNLVDTVHPNQSVLYMKISTGTMNQYIKTPVNQQIILNWITQGAKNN